MRPSFLVIAQVLGTLPSLSTGSPTADQSRLTPSTNPSQCALPAVPGVYLSIGHNYTDTPNCAPSTGTLSSYMIFVDFPDQPSGSDSTQNLHDFFLPEAAEWYTNASYGKLSLVTKSDTSRFYRMPQNADTYGFQRGISYWEHLRYIQDAVDQWEKQQQQEQAGGEFRDLSSAAFPVVDVLYIVASRNSPTISFSPAFMGEVYSPASGKLVARKAVTIGQDAYRAFGYKVLNHETGHSMCLPDLYPFAGPTGLYVGGWDLMGWINGPSPDYFAWNKWRQGWIEDEEIACVAAKGRYVFKLGPLEADTCQGHRAVVIRKSDTEALVAEVRSSRGVDSAICDSGVLLYTVDTSVPTGQGPIKVIDTKPDSVGCHGEPLNDAPISGVGSTFDVPGWNVSIKILRYSKRTGTWTIEVVRS